MPEENEVEFAPETAQFISLISTYSNKDIFLFELINNSIDVSNFERKKIERPFCFCFCSFFSFSIHNSSYMSHDQVKKEKTTWLMQ